MAATLKPEVIWIEGRCYRVNDPSTEVTALQEYDLYENGMIFNHYLKPVAIFIFWWKSGLKKPSKIRSDAV